jgi:hypothetical protein
MRSSIVTRTVACGLAIIATALPFGINSEALAWQDNASLKRGTGSRPSQFKGATAALAVPVSDEVRREVDGLRERGARHIRMNPATGRPGAIYGDLGTIVSETSAKRSEGAGDVVSYLARNSVLVGTEQPDRDLTLARHVESPAGSHYYFDQTVAGLRVFDAETAVHVDRSGTVRAMTNGFVSGIETSVGYAKPALDEAGAREAAIATLGAITVDQNAQSPVELGIAADGIGRLAYRVVVETIEPLDAFSVVVDAATGERIGEPRSVARYDGTANVMVTNAVVDSGNTGLTDGGNSSGAVPGGAYTSRTLTRLAATGFLDGPAVSTASTSTRLSAANGNFSNFQRGDAGYEAIEIYWAIETAQRYYQDVLNINNAANYQIQVDAMWAPGGNQNIDNSRYLSNGTGIGRLEFGLGGVDDGEDGEIVWHEYGHATLDNQRPGINGLEGGSIHEGWGDYLAATLSTTVPGDSRFHALVGEWDATSYDFHDPTYLRRVDGNKVYPDDLNFEVHDDGEIWAAILWGIHQSVGRAVADPIIFNANFLFPQDVGFEDGAAALLQSDQMLNAGANSAAITAVLAAHGLAAGQPQTPTISTVQYKKVKLVVDGQLFGASDSVVEINGVRVDQSKHPAAFINGNVTTRVVGKDASLKQMLPKGTPVQVTVLNTSSGLRSAPFTFTR